MKIKDLLFMSTAVLFLATGASAADFYGASIADRDAPTAAWKVGVTGFHPTVTSLSFDSPARQAGLAAGDIILSINSKEITKSAELHAFTDTALKIEIVSGSARRFIVIVPLKASPIGTQVKAPPAAIQARTPVVPQETPPKTDMAATRPAHRGSSDIITELAVVAGHRRDLNDLFGRGGRSQLEQFLSEVYSPEVAEATFKRCLVQKLDHQELANVLAWYKSPLGRKIVDADSVVDFNRREHVLMYASNDAEQGFRERMHLVGQIEKSVGGAEFEIKLMKLMLHKMVNSIPPNFPDKERFRERVKDLIPALESKQKENTQKYAYTYRDLSLRELHSYLTFLHSSTGRKYISAVKEGTEELFKKVAINFEKDFHDQIKLLMD